jgi:predicted DNA-binding transcriptional regulator AlpA
MNREELLALPATVDIPTAARALSIGRTLAYQLARAGQFPVPVLRLGSRYRVPSSALLAALGIQLAPDPPRPPVAVSPPNLRPVAGL